MAGVIQLPYRLTGENDENLPFRIQKNFDELAYVLGGLQIYQNATANPLDVTVSQKMGSWDQAATDSASALSKANTVTSITADIASDSKLTPNKKQIIKLKWDAIVAEKTPLDTQATNYAITTEKTDYDTKYDALSAYITPLLADLTLTSDIVGATLRTNFTNYYTSKLTLLNKVANVAKALVDTSVQQGTAYSGTASTVTTSSGTVIPPDLVVALPVSFQGKSFTIIPWVQTWDVIIDDLVPFRKTHLELVSKDTANGTFTIRAYAYYSNSDATTIKWSGLTFGYTVIL